MGGHIFGRAIYWEGMGGHPCTNTTLSKHFNETILWDIWWDNMKRHFDYKFWWDILFDIWMRHFVRLFDVKFGWNILMRHFYCLCRTFMSCNDRWWPLMTFVMVMLLRGWPYDSFNHILFTEQSKDGTLLDIFIFTQTSVLRHWHCGYCQYGNCHHQYKNKHSGRWSFLCVLIK